jgi:hypothetical protein
MIPKAEDSRKMSENIRKAVYSLEKILERAENVIAHATNAGYCAASLSSDDIARFDQKTLEQLEKELISLGYIVYKYSTSFGETPKWDNVSYVGINWDKV